MATIKSVSTLLVDGDWIESKDQSLEGIRLIQTGNIGIGEYLDKTNRAKYISEETLERLNCTELMSGDILISRLPDPIGRACRVPNNIGRAITAVDCTIIRLNPDKCDAEYFVQYTQSKMYQNRLSQFFAGSTRTRISRKNLEQVGIPLPSIAEQRHIALTLGKVDNLITLRKEQLAKLDELVKARLVEMFGDVVHNTKHWPVHRFSDITTSRLGKMLDSKCQTGENSYPYLANFNVQWFRFNLENLNRMDFTEKDRIEFELQDGDLLVCEGGEIGRCAVWHNEIQPCYFQKALHRVRCDKEQILPYYLAWWFKFNCEHDGFAEIEGAKATIAHLPGAKLKALLVVVPPLELQEKFTFFVEQTDRTKLTLQESLGRLEEMKKALMQEYFG